MPTAKTSKSAAATPAADAVKQIEDHVVAHQETIEAAVKTGAEAATQVVEKVVAHTKEHVEAANQVVEKVVAHTKEHVEAAVKAGAAAFKGYDDIFQFGKDNVEAIVASSSIVVRGVQDLSRSVATLAQSSLEESVAASKALFGAKTLKEVIDLSSTLAKTNLDKLVNEGNKIGHASAKLAQDAFAPINSRVEAAVEKLTKTAA